jgi:uncharacterized protein with HEPN domain
VKRPIVTRLRDRLEAIEAVEEMIDGVDLAAYRTDIKLRLAVERAIEIVSEASRFLPEAAKASFPSVAWAEIAAIGNKLRHEYQRIDDRLMFKVATRSLTDLKPVVQELIRRA